jgi:outer membrane lipoprotein-sorting protein
MKNAPFRVFCLAMPAMFVLAGAARFTRPVAAQNQEMQERVAEIKQAMAQNKQDKTQKNLVSLSIATYLNEPSDAVNVTVAFARVPNGPTCVRGNH